MILDFSYDRFGAQPESAGLDGMVFWWSIGNVAAPVFAAQQQIMLLGAGS